MGSVESPSASDSRTRRQVEQYRSKQGSRNGAQSVLGVLRVLPTFEAKAKVPSPQTMRAKPEKTASEVQGILNDIGFMGQKFSVRETTDGFLIAVGGHPWFVSPHATEEDIVETAFVACQRVLYDSFTFRGRRIFPHRKERGVASDAPSKSVLTSGFRLKVAPREMEKVVKILQGYFKVSRERARDVVRSRGRTTSLLVKPFQVDELNHRFARYRLQTSASWISV